MTATPAISASPATNTSGNQFGLRKMAAGAAAGFWISAAWLIASRLPSPSGGGGSRGLALSGSVIGGWSPVHAPHDGPTSPRYHPTVPNGRTPAFVTLWSAAGPRGAGSW